MTNDKTILHNIENDILLHKDLGNALRNIRAYLSTPKHIADVAEKTDAIAQDYQRMKSYLLLGYDDEQRSNLYNDLLQKLHGVLGNLQLADFISEHPTFSAAQQHGSHVNQQPEDIRQHLEQFVQDITMLSLEQADTAKENKLALHQKHHAYMSALFDSMLTAYQWSEAMAEGILTLLLSPTIESRDAQLITTAVSLSAMNVFDPYKWLLLIKLYHQSADTYVKQRALVGWLFSIDSHRLSIYPHINEYIQQVLTEEAVRQDIIELQIQVFYCLDTDQDAAKIEKEIIPNLMKNKDFRMNMLNHEEEDDNIEEILNYGETNEKMEEMEEHIKKIIDMQRAGTDIYFSGFSQMKRFPFFYTLSNWFCPFYKEHPELHHIEQQIDDNKFFQNIFQNAPFCNSDKYSFALTLTQIVDKLPPAVKEAMESGEGIGDYVSYTDQQQPAYIRRMYLSDLYRFFRVFPQNKDFINPFSNKSDSKAVFIFNKAVRERLDNGDINKLKLFLFKKKKYDTLEKVCKEWFEDTDFDDLMMLGKCKEATGRYEEAVECYEKATLLRPKSKRALRGLAYSQLCLNHFSEAEKYYKQLLEISSSNLSDHIKACIAGLYTENINNAVNTLYKLDYENPETLSIQRVLAWGLLLCGKAKQAEAIYEKLLSTQKPDSSDYLNMGYCKWLLKDIQSAIDFLKLCVATHPQGNSYLIHNLKNDSIVFKKNGISEVEVKIVTDLVISKDEY